MLQIAIYLFTPVAIIAGIASLISVVRFVIGVHAEIRKE